MKWLLLVLMISCGKEEMPKAIDLLDSDGDQIIGEVGDAKYIADFLQIGEVNGQMSFKSGDLVKKEIFIKISNARNLFEESIDILTQSQLKKLPQDFSSEFSKILVETPKILPVLEDRIFDITLSFLPSDSPPDVLLLIDGKSTVKIADFKTTLNLKLNKKDLDSLLSKKTYLAFGKRTILQKFHDSLPVQETIREKTYRIFYNDGLTGKIFYVSHDYSFESFLINKNISKARPFFDIDAFQIPAGETEWFYRHFDDGDKVLVKTGNENILKSYLKNFQRTDITLRRENGSSVNSLKINKANESLIHLKFRATKTERTFREYVEKVRHTIGGGREGSPEQWHCMNYYRVVDTETSVPVVNQSLLTNMMIRVNNSQYPLAVLDHVISQKDDEIGQYIQVTLRLHTESLEVYLQNNANDTFVLTGRYDLNCGRDLVRGAISVVPTNIEGSLNLAMEAYVEKLD